MIGKYNIKLILHIIKTNIQIQHVKYNSTFIPYSILMMYITGEYSNAGTTFLLLTLSS